MTSKTMKAAVFVEPGRIELREKPIPEIGPDDALVRVTTTTICGTDIHIRKGEYAVPLGLTIGHEPVGIIEKLGSAVKGYKEGDRVLCSAVTPGGHSSACLCGMHSYDGGDNQHGWQIAGGWRLGNTIDGTQAEFFVVPHAKANLAIVPNQLTDEEVLMVPDIMSTGFAAAESGKVGIGDIVAVFAQGPIGLCATAGARLSGAAKVIAVDRVPNRLATATLLGADHTVDFTKVDPVEEIMMITSGRGVDVSVEALGTQATFENALKVLRPAGTLSSVGIYPQDLTIPIKAFGQGVGGFKIVTTTCPGGKERMRQLMEVIAAGRVDLKPLVTHRFKLDDIEEAYDLFASQRDGVMKVAITV
jgi:alcohol dehydrogenase